MTNFTVKEALLTLQWIIERKPEYADKPLLVTTNDRSIGGRACVEVQDIYQGIDWEHGQIRIQPCEDIVKKYNGRDIEKDKWLFTERITNKKYPVCSSCTCRVAKPDQYCKHCGQRLNNVLIDKGFTL